MATILKYARTEQGANHSADDSILNEVHTIITSEPVSYEWIVSHPDTPKLHSEYKRHPGFYFRTINPTRRKKLVWEIAVTASRFQLPKVQDSPLDEPAKISRDSQEISEPTLFDYKGRPITTTAGEWIDGVFVERSRWIYRVRKNVGSDPAWLDDYGCAINSDAIRIRGRLLKPLTLMFRRGQMSDYDIKNGISFSVLSFELHYRPETWIQKKWNAGTVEAVQDKDTKKYRQQPILIGFPPQRTDKPVFLDRKGAVIPGALDPSGETPFDLSKLHPLSIQTQIALPFRVLPLN